MGDGARSSSKVSQRQPTCPSYGLHASLRISMDSSMWFCGRKGRVGGVRTSALRRSPSSSGTRLAPLSARFYCDKGPPLEQRYATRASGTSWDTCSDEACEEPQSTAATDEDSGTTTSPPPHWQDDIAPGAADTKPTHAVASSGGRGSRRLIVSRPLASQFFMSGHDVQAMLVHPRRRRRRQQAATTS